MSRMSNTRDLSRPIHFPFIGAEKHIPAPTNPVSFTDQSTYRFRVNGDIAVTTFILAWCLQLHFVPFTDNSIVA